MNIAEVRKQYPQYNDLSDQQLADALHQKFYADMPVAEFYQRVGLQQEAEQPQRSLSQELMRQVGLTGRALAEFGVEVVAPLANTVALGANKVIEGAEAVGLNEPGGFRFPEQSGAFSQALTNAGVPAPENNFERGVQTAAKLTAGVMSGGAVDRAVRQVVGPVPQGVSAQTRNLTSAQRQGYVVPPADTNPTFVNRSVQGLAGKASVNQAASYKNQQVTNRLAARALGLPDDMPVSVETLKNLRQTAGQAYENVRRVGTVTADDEFRAALERATAAVKNVKSEFPDLPIEDASAAINAINKPSFSSDAAVDAIRVFREMADGAYRSGSTGLGRAYKAAAEAMEGAVERHLKGLAQQGRQVTGVDGKPLNIRTMWRDFRDSRRLIAKTYSVESALNDATGNVDARALARQLGKGKPLEGELLEAARFGMAHPRSVQPGVNMPGPSVADWALGGVGGVAVNPLVAAWPILRDATRRGLVSRPGQALANPLGMRPTAAPLPVIGPAASAVDD